VGLITAAVGAGIVNFLGVTDPAVRNIGILVTVSSILFIVLGYMLYIWRGYKTKKRGKLFEMRAVSLDQKLTQSLSGTKTAVTTTQSRR